MNLADLIERNAAFTPAKPALRFQDTEWTYQDFAERIATLARVLKSGLGVCRGDRVAVLATNHPDYLALLYACARLGAMLVPLNWRHAVPEQMFILSDAGARTLFVAQAFDAVCAPLASVMPGTHLVGLNYTPTDGQSLEALMAAENGAEAEHGVGWQTPLLIVYTAGTTGRPKGAVLTQEALVWNAAMSQHMHAMTSEDHVLTVLPLFHVGGLNIQTTPALQLGATVTLHSRFMAGETLRAMAEDRPTLTVLVPSTIQALIEHPAWPEADLSNLRAITTGSTIVPQALVDAIAVRGVSVLQVYGATETCPIAVYTRLGGDTSRVGSTGQPGLFCEARVVDETGQEVPDGVPGEVIVRGPSVLTEYWRNPTATADALRDGWFWTGDIAQRDADGHFTIHDRKNNMIVSGGENIYPAEIERALLDHPAVAEAAVIGVPDPRWQEVPLAFVVLRAGAVASTDDLRAYLRERLARFKVPREIVFVAGLPRNALGKVQHFRLKESWGAGVTAWSDQR
jgi:fatty-acyl-CoA synthase